MVISHKKEQNGIQNLMEQEQAILKETQLIKQTTFVMLLKKIVRLLYMLIG